MVSSNLPIALINRFRCAFTTVCQNGFVGLFSTMFVKLPSYPMILSADAGARQAGSSPRLTAEASREAPSIRREAPAETRLTIIEAVKTLAFVAAIFVCGFLTRPAIMSDKWHDQVLVSCVSSVILLGKVFLWFLVPLILFWFYVEFKAYQVSLSNTH